jgi:ssDNA-binding Zn-finger/Zn-ribbon topoisomerase 1
MLKKTVLNIPVAMEEYAKSHGAQKEILKDQTPPSCPKCGKLMKLRKNNKTNSNYFGCNDFNCRGSKSLTYEWFYVGELPIELEDFIIHNKPTSYKQSPQCPLCGGQMQLKQKSIRNTEFWSCMGYPSCKGIRKSDIPFSSSNFNKPSEYTKKQTIKTNNDKTLIPTQIPINHTVLIEFLELASDVLGDIRNAEKWLTTPKLTLLNKRPIDILDTTDGQSKIKAMLDTLHK